MSTISFRVVTKLDVANVTDLRRRGQRGALLVPAQPLRPQNRFRLGCREAARVWTDSRTWWVFLFVVFPPRPRDAGVSPRLSARQPPAAFVRMDERQPVTTVRLDGGKADDVPSNRQRKGRVYPNQKGGP